ncbi:MAG: von Willebrand factor type A domain-containing protein [Candidatus Omnitrophica bacterium]|nr:von Willebrand factor type A domain-containing protein [Candidatus Omnitrophota bacterium]
MTKHKEFEQLISCYIDGELSSQESTRVENHLKTCAECRAYKRSIQSISTNLMSWGDEDLSPDLEQKIYRHTRIPPVSARKTKSFNPIFAGSSLLVLLLIGYTSFQVYKMTTPFERDVVLKHARTEKSGKKQTPTTQPSDEGLVLVDTKRIQEKASLEQTVVRLPASIDKESSPKKTFHVALQNRDTDPSSPMIEGAQLIGFQSTNGAGRSGSRLRRMDLSSSLTAPRLKRTMIPPPQLKGTSSARLVKPAKVLPGQAEWKRKSGAALKDTRGIITRKALEKKKEAPVIFGADAYDQMRSSDKNEIILNTRSFVAERQTIANDIIVDTRSLSAANSKADVEISRGGEMPASSSRENLIHAQDLEVYRGGILPDTTKEYDRMAAQKSEPKIIEIAKPQEGLLAKAGSMAEEEADAVRPFIQIFQGGAELGGYTEYVDAPTRSLKKDMHVYPITPVAGEDDAFNTEDYDRIVENEFLICKKNPLSTFSIDVDTASYSNIRRFLDTETMPDQDSVRLEEMINYFTYAYPYPKEEQPFSVTTEIAPCPWNPAHQLCLIGLQGKILEPNSIPPSNLVFLIDVSGSMDQPDKLPLLKKAFRLFVNQLSGQERVAIVVYAGAAGTVLESTPGSSRNAILEAIDRLSAGGSTAGGAGIALAYDLARHHFIKEGNNRVVLATDGDFNIGSSSDAAMVRLIEKNRDDGIFLTVLGFGTGNVKDAKMKKIADQGNGNYYYIDSTREAQKVLVNELGSTLFTIARDVKIQVEFNPAHIKAYRLIGYEDRMLTKEDFNNDRKDAGEIGAGHSVTALYELVLVDSDEEFQETDELRYQKNAIVSNPELMNIKLRYKNPSENTSRLIEIPIHQSDGEAAPSDNFNFASSVAEFGLLLRHSPFKASASYDNVLRRARGTIQIDPYGYRKEFISLVEKAQSLDMPDTRPAEGMYFKGRPE